MYVNFAFQFTRKRKLMLTGRQCYGGGKQHYPISEAGGGRNSCSLGNDT